MSRRALVEQALEEEASEQIRNWEQEAVDEFEDEMADNADVTDLEFWDDWNYPDEYDWDIGD